MVEDKSLIHYGAIYHKTLDHAFTAVRQTVSDLITEGSSILDIACGTGSFTQLMRENKKCHVVGIDLSLKMIEFAKKNHSSPEVTFFHKDATDLSDLAGNSFDYATIMFFYP